MTIVELLVTISVLTIVTLALTGLIQSFYKDNDYLIESTAALASSRTGVQNMVSGIREATYGDDGSYLVGAAATSSLTIYSDIDQDPGVEKVQYTLTNGTLYEFITNATGTPPAYPISARATTTIATNVRNTDATPVFTYYDNAGNVLSSTSTNVAAITSVRVQVLVDINPNRAPNVFTLSDMATLRNLQTH